MTLSLTNGGSWPALWFVLSEFKLTLFQCCFHSAGKTKEVHLEQNCRLPNANSSVFPACVAKKFRLPVFVQHSAVQRLVPFHQSSYSVRLTSDTGDTTKCVVRYSCSIFLVVKTRLAKWFSLHYRHLLDAALGRHRKEECILKTPNVLSTGSWADFLGRRVGGSCSGICLRSRSLPCHNYIQLYW